MTPEEIIEELQEIDDSLLTADGFDDALIGYVTIYSNTVALYDRDKCIEILIQRDKMSLQEAEEFFDVNVVGAYVGEKTPAFAKILK